ncbi:MAG TPA: hypothetical protein VMK65_10690, partial [Longimicrobiales bacterium]|nr:hypothetical protein [Longimicrobiales bacterium]
LPIVLATAFVQEGMPLSSAPDPTLLPGLEGTPVAEPPSPASPTLLHGFLTWRRAILGGVVAFTLLGATTGGWMGMRATGVGPVGSLVAKGVLEERDRVILADFEPMGGDSALADLVTEALRIDLLQSSILRLAEPSWLSGALDRMEREGERVGLPLALEVAEREGVKAVIAGEVGRAGGGYILTARVVTADGDAAAAFRETARDSTELLDAIDRLSGAMRARVGESLSAIRASPPLEQVTTASIEALRLFTEAERNNGPLERRDRAIALDSTFAMAYRKKAMWLANGGLDPSGSVNALRKAYRYRDRLSPIERHLTTAAYFHSADEDLGRAIAAYEEVLELDPLQPSALNNLPTLYARRGRLADAVELSGRGLSSTHFPTHYGNHVTLQLRMGDVAAADSTLERLGRHLPDAVAYRDRVRVWIAAGQRRFAEADSLARIVEAHGTAFAEYMGSYYRYTALGAMGRLEGSRAEAEESAAVAAERGFPHAALRRVLLAADVDLEVLGDTAAAVRRIEGALVRLPLDSMDALNRPYLELAHAYARTGRTERAAKLLEEYERMVPADARGTFTGWSLIMARRARGALALSQGRVAEALAELREADRDADCLCHLPELGRAYEAASQPDSALIAYHAYLDPPVLEPLTEDAAYLGQVLLRAAELHEARGERRDAAALYTRLAELWRDADPVLQPRVAEARRRAGALLSEG